VYREYDPPHWHGPTGFYHMDFQSLPSRNESKTWENLYVWAYPSHSSNTMYVSFLADMTFLCEGRTASRLDPPPMDRRFLLELLSVPDGVVGAPPVGRIWALPRGPLFTIALPTYRTTNGLTGYRFSFTITEAEPEPGDLDNDGDVDRDDLVIFDRCLAGPGSQPGPGCSPQDFIRSDLNLDDRVDLSDFSLFMAKFTGLLASWPRYVGRTACIDCHEANHTSWLETRHASAFDRLTGDGEEENPACLPCHTVGYGATGGFVDVDTTPELAGVQCENCHGPGSHHAADAENVGLDVQLDSAMCGDCHRSCHGMCGDYYHPHYEQWSTSKHAQALADIRWLPEYEQSCLECHSADYRLASEGAKPAATEALYNLECVACHDPHGSANAYHLRLPAESLCAQCHTMDNAMPGQEPDRPQFEFLHGFGGFALDWTPLDGMYPTPFVILDGKCVFCHVHREVYGGPEQPANSGHTFESDIRACAPCHSEADATVRITTVYDEIAPRMATIARYLDPGDPVYVDPAALSLEERERYIIAKFNYELVNADRSFGAHNAPFARRLLEETETFFGITP